MDHPQRAGRIVVISGPSGSGKSTILREVLDDCPVPLRFSVSATTRAPREGELHGRDYFFLSPEAFAAKRAAGEFLECFELFGKGHWYGTLRAEVEKSLATGDWVLLEIDVQGARAVADQFPKAITIFIDPGGLEELERRLRARGTEDEPQIQARLATARRELENASWYTHRVVNADVSRTAREICQILLGYRGETA